MKIYDNAVREFPSNAALDLVPLPEESMVSSIWRFAWRNGLGVKELLTHCTHGAGYRKEHATFSYKRGFDPDVFSHSSWWIDEPSEKEVFGSSSEKHRSIWWNTAFRYCPLCLGHLYHSFWHQSKFLPLPARWSCTARYVLLVRQASAHLRISSRDPKQAIRLRALQRSHLRRWIERGCSVGDTAKQKGIRASF